MLLQMELARQPGDWTVVLLMYGGYATFVGLTFTPDAFACGVDIVGPSNLQTLLSSIPPYSSSLVRRTG